VDIDGKAATRHERTETGGHRRHDVAGPKVAIIFDP
jgi:hypothetical protein